MGVFDMVAAPILDIVNKLIPDPVAKAQIQEQLAQLQQNEEFKQIDAQLATTQQQTDIDKTEAANTNIFIAGWRPAVGWVCAFGFAYNFMISPFLGWIALSLHWPEPPVIAIGPLSQMLTGMLGFGVMRTFEKIKGINSGN